MQLYREERQKDPLSADSFPKWPQWWELSQSEVRSFFQVSNVSADSQGLRPSYNAFPCPMQGAGWEAEQLGYKLMPIWDPSTGLLYQVQKSVISNLNSGARCYRGS